MESIEGNSHKETVKCSAYSICACSSDGRQLALGVHLLRCSSDNIEVKVHWECLKVGAGNEAQFLGGKPSFLLESTLQCMMVFIV